jgi:hypothetical protein
VRSPQSHFLVGALICTIISDVTRRDKGETGLPDNGLCGIPVNPGREGQEPKSNLPIGIYLDPGGRASTAPAELARTAGAMVRT